MLANQRAVLVAHPFSLFSFDFNNDVDFSFFHCRHVDFVTTPCFIQVPRILSEVPGLLAPDSFSNFIFVLFFSFSDRPTQNQKTHSTINEKKKGWPDGKSTGNSYFKFSKISIFFPYKVSRHVRRSQSSLSVRPSQIFQPIRLQH